MVLSIEIERKLKEKCDIPIFHDDQHGTAVITLAGLTNALKVVGKKKEDVKVVTSGAGAAAISIVKLITTLITAYCQDSIYLSVRLWHKADCQIRFRPVLIS